MTRPDDKPQSFEEAAFALRLAVWDFVEVFKSQMAEVVRVVLSDRH